MKNGNTETTIAEGSDDQSNLWPQPRRRIEEKWNAEAKDRLERLTCDMVCDGQLDIATAQEAFAADWIAAYRITRAGIGDTGKPVLVGKTLDLSFWQDQ